MRLRVDEPAHALEKQAGLDQPAGLYAAAIEKVLPRGPVRDALHGVWLGHPLHPALVQLPVGAFASAVILDWLPGDRRDADTLLAVGLLASVPAAVTGAADYSQGQPDQQRVGLVHAAANGVASLLYLGSLAQRRRGRRTAGRLTALAGFAVSGIAASLGGHLSFSMAMGANRAEGVPDVVPSGSTDLGPLTELPEGEAVRRMIGPVPVMVLRQDDAVHVLADQCSHADGPLHQGTVSRDAAGELCVECPWHGSVFALADGAVRRGPATADQPVFDTQVVGGRVQATLRS
ncbi:Rieske 2Fe-2S domain-containing protein [Rhodococcus sp. X156]|uniref:Rieske 2Fe-2S domain-containing protein n=1 Tax=Rhodococcus sp. X156 TaxID=2499145 RepID=UPI000FD9AD4D|nr:Rieske 2Fe-2S domain-containing protein [Rhodococcus sp. X156]